MLTLKNSLYLLLETVELPKYNSEKDFGKFLQWLDIYDLPFLGKGMSRTVFDLEDGTVLKVANDSFCIDHNEDEVKIIKCMNGQLVPELIDFEPNYFWLRLEKVEKVTEKDIYNYWVEQRAWIGNLRSGISIPFMTC
ncbi:MAG: hypothetical protein HC899_37755 [Leptolyngbyaceae cyanobacterium SM1_4_3]|nr:hypothetical protein [Leptolyngbyaceae cyanobacterium SM1_4_3]